MKQARLADRLIREYIFLHISTVLDLCRTQNFHKQFLTLKMKIRENLNTLHKSSWLLVDEQTVPPILVLQQHLHLHFGEERWRHTDQALGDAAGAMGFQQLWACFTCGMVSYGSSDGDGAAFDPHVNHHLAPSQRHRCHR